METLGSQTILSTVKLCKHLEIFCDLILRLTFFQSRMLESILEFSKLKITDKEYLPMLMNGKVKGKEVGALIQ